MLLSIKRCPPVIEHVGEFVPWILAEKGVVPLHNDDTGLARYGNVVRDGILDNVVEAGCHDRRVWLMRWRNGYCLESLDEREEAVKIVREGCTTSFECFFRIRERGEDGFRVVKPILVMLAAVVRVIDAQPCPLFSPP